MRVADEVDGCTGSQWFVFICVTWLVGCAHAAVVVQSNCTSGLGEMPGCEIPGRSGFAFHSSQGLEGVGHDQVAGMQGGGSEGKPSTLLFAVKDCLRA